MKKFPRKQQTIIFLKSFVLLVTGLFIFNTSKAQTYVSGGIYSNTTWTTAGSPYIVTDTLVVFSGIKLTIEPGVVVKFDNTVPMEMEGTLVANGTAADSIIFTSNSATPYAGIYPGIIANSGTQSFRYCRFSYASNALLSGSAVLSRCSFFSNIEAYNCNTNLANIDSSVFKYDTVGMDSPLEGSPINYCEFYKNSTAIFMPYGMIAYCTFRNNGRGIAEGLQSAHNCIFDSNYEALSGEDTIIDCSFKYNHLAISSEETYIQYNDISNNYIGIESYGDYISCNTICSNTDYNIIAEMNTNELVSNNYWCLNDSAHIQATIYDAYQNISLGFIYFTPFDTVPCTPPPCNLTLHVNATEDTICQGGHTNLGFTATDTFMLSTATWNPGNHSGYYYIVSPSLTTTYTLELWDINGCHKTDSITITVTPTPTINISPIPATLCSSTAPIILSATPVGGTFSGSGVSGNTFYPSHVTGHVTITYTYASSCPTVSGSISTDVLSPQRPPSICYVTTDTSSSFNTVVWQKIGMDTLAIDSVIIYRQDVLNNYVPVGEVSVHAFSAYNDHTALPLVEPYFYALGVQDSCGGDTLISPPNETVFLQSSIGTGPNVVNLNWNFYGGSPVLYYRILRDDSGSGNWHAIDSVQGTINAFSDRSAPINAGLRYMINTDWNITCTPSSIKPRHSSHYIFNTDNISYSNMTYIFPTGVSTILDNHSIKVYPNPVNDAVSISFSNAFEGMVKITDVLGQDVYTSNLSANGGSVKKISMATLANGVYFITLQGKGTLYRTKVIKM